MAKVAVEKQTRSLIGEALIKEGLLTPEQLERALRIQKHLEQQRQLGEVLIELGYATKQSIRDAINKHGAGMRIGDMLVEQGPRPAELSRPHRWWPAVLVGVLAYLVTAVVVDRIRSDE